MESYSLTNTNLRNYHVLFSLTVPMLLAVVEHNNGIDSTGTNIHSTESSLK